MNSHVSTLCEDVTVTGTSSGVRPAKSAESRVEYGPVHETTSRP